MVGFPPTSRQACTPMEQKACWHSPSIYPHPSLRLLPSCFHLPFHFFLHLTFTSLPNTELSHWNRTHSCPCPLLRSQEQVCIAGPCGFQQLSRVSDCTADQLLCIQTVQDDAFPQVVIPHQELCEAIIIPWFIYNFRKGDSYSWCPHRAQLIQISAASELIVLYVHKSAQGLSWQPLLSNQAGKR